MVCFCKDINICVDSIKKGGGEGGYSHPIITTVGFDLKMNVKMFPLQQ